MIRLEMKNYNTILTEKQEKYRHYYQVKLINMHLLPVNKYYPLIKVECQNKLSLLTLSQENLFEKQIKTIDVHGRKKFWNHKNISKSQNQLKDKTARK